MTQPARRLEERVSELETEVAKVRYLATKAERDGADTQTVLKGHSGVINAIRNDQIEQGMRLRVVEAHLNNVYSEMRESFIAVGLDAARNVTLLSAGQARITELITRHIEECDKG